MTLKYFSYETFVKMGLIQAIIGTGCLVFLLFLGKRIRIIDLSINLAVLLGATVPALLKLVSIKYLQPDSAI